MARIIEAVAKISAVDATNGVFDKIAKKIEAIGKTRVIELHEALQGGGRVRAERPMESREKARSSRVRGIGGQQRGAHLRAASGRKRGARDTGP